MEKKILYEKYLDNEMKQLKRITNGIIFKMGYPYTDMCIEDFYDVALNTLWNVVENYYDESRCDKFEPYLLICLRSKFKSYKEKMYESKRDASVIGRRRIPATICVSIDIPIGDDDGLYLKDVIADSRNVFDEVFDEEPDDRESLFRSKLTRIGNKILDLLMIGHNATEIQKILNISPVTYRNHFVNMERYKYILKGENLE